MNDVYGFNFKPQDLWSSKDKSGQFKVEGMTADEWVAAKKGTYDQFWNEIRYSQLQDNFNKIWKTSKRSSSPAGFPLDGVFRMLGSSGNQGVLQTLESMDQWERFAEIRKTGGKAIGFDLETFGEVTKAGTDPAQFGITEFAIGTRIYDGSDVIKTDGESFIFGINDEQYKYLTSLNDRFQSQGWNSLGDTEKVALDRMSMYAGQDAILDKVIPEYGNKTFKVAGTLSQKTRNVNSIREGIEKLHNVYKDSKHKQPELLEMLMQKIISANNDNNTILFGANSNYDIDALINVAKTFGIDTDNVNSLRSNVLDIIYSARALSTSESQSMNQYFKTMHGVKAGASVDEQLSVYRINSTQLHQGYGDLLNEGRILDIRLQEVIDAKSKLEGVRNKYKQYSGISDSVFLVRNGKLNQERAQEMAIINGKPEASYSYTNEYWTIDEGHSNYVELDGEKKYALTLNNYIDGENTSVTIVRNTREEALEELVRNSSVFNTKQVTESDALGQRAFKYKDFGRREFDKTISPSSVALDNGNDIYGYETLKAYLNLADEMPKELNIKPDGDSVSKVIEYIEKTYPDKNSSGYSLVQHLKEQYTEGPISKIVNKLEKKYTAKNNASVRDVLQYIDTLKDKESITELKKYITNNYVKKKPIKSYYQAQAFVGMYEKIQTERQLLQDIVDQIEKQYGSQQGTNIDKTIVLRRAYTDAINHMDETYGRRQAGKYYNVMSDALGIDVKMPDENIKRINAYSPDTISSDIRRIFKNLDSDEIRNIIEDLYDRNMFLDEDKYTNIIKRISNMTSDDLYGISQDLGYELSKVTQEYIDKDKSIVHAFRNTDGRNKNIQFLGQKLETDRIIKYEGKTFEEAYKESADSINKIISNATNNAPNTIYVNTLDYTNDNTILKNYINKIASELNIEQMPFKNLEGAEKTGASLLYELFTKTKNYQGEETRYAINNYIDKGLTTFLTMGENGNAYLFLTRKQDAAKFYSNLLDGKFNLSSKAELIDPRNTDMYLPIHDYASFVEISKINEYQLSEGTLRTVNQGSIEKVIIPELNVSTNSKGQMRAYYNSGEFGYLSTLRMSMGGAIEHVLLGEYEAGSASVRKAQGNYLEDLSSSASYRGRVILDDAGNVIDIKRIAEFTPNDYIQAHETKVTNALYDLFKGAVKTDASNDLNVAQKIVMAFGKQSGKEFLPRNDQMKYMTDIVDNVEFGEFFTKRLFTGTISGDTYLSGTLNGPEFNKNFFQILKDIANDETIHLFDSSVAEALDKIPTNEIMNQILSESALEKGIVSVGIRPGDYNDAASLYSTMRPTYVQQNNGMSFSIDEMDISKFTGFQKKDFLNDTASIRFNTAVIAGLEYDDRMALANSGYQPIPGQDYAKRRRSMVARVKQMGDYDLQLKYIEMQENADSIAKELKISNTRYRNSLEYFQQNFMSLHADKIFIAPGLNEQTLFQDREAKKILYNLDGLDVTRSYKKMNSLVRNKEIVTANTVIGIRNDGTPVFHQGPDVVFTEKNLQDIFDDVKSTSSIKKTYAIPIQGDIFDNKIMINGSEKGTTHSINIKSFMDYTGIGNRNEALRIANALFDKVFDGAIAVGNFGLESHGNIASIHSIWNTITTQYIENGYGESLKGHLNRLVAENDAFKGFGEFRFINGELISSSSNARNFSAAVEVLYDQIRTNSVLRSDINNKIVSELTDLNTHSSFNAILQRQSMNEHMGTRMVIDQRLEQGIRTRGMQMGGHGMQAIDNDWADMIKVYSQNYNAKGTSLTGELRDFVNIYGATKNSSRIHLNSGKTDIQRSAKGIVESMMYYYNPKKYNPDGKNIVKININDLIDEGVRLKGGLSVKDLQDSIFFVNGKPSDFLQKAAKKSNVNLYDKSYSVFIDLGKTSFTVSEMIGKEKSVRTFNGVMVPIQTIFENIDDKTYFQSQQATVARFLNKLIDITTNPQKYKKNGIEAELSSSYSKFQAELAGQLGYLDKESDVYKAFQQYIMPTSQELLAQDESAPLVKEMMDSDMQKLIKKKNNLEELLMINPSNKSAITELDEVYSKIDTKLKSIGERIRTDNKYYSDLMSLSTNKNLLNASKVEIKGKTHYGLAVAISKEAFERQGISVGAVGLEAFQNWETKNYQLEKIEKFSKDHGFGARKVTIARKLNQLNIDGLHIDSSKSITEQLNAYIKKKYNVDNLSMLSIKDLNKAMIENKGPAQILNAFDEIGKLYLSEVGTIGELTRYPAFRSQPMVRVILDETLTGKQLRGSSAIISSLSNVDFDGDKQFLAMLTDGISIVNKNTTITLDDGRKLNVLNTQKAILDRFATTESRGLLAELIEKGDIFEVDNPNAITRQYAAMLKKFKPQIYEEAAMKWAKDNSIHVSSFEKLSESKAMMYAASSSKQMHDAFTNMKFNTMTDEDAIISSIASRFRKKNIGTISTPNYHMRNALLTAMQDPTMSLEQKQLLNDTYVSLSNMLSKAGGFFSEAEQKSIDVKHAKDGLEVAKTTRYSTGMTMLFGTSKHYPDKNIAGIRNILEATNSGIFKVNNAELNRMANLVANTPVDKFEDTIKTLYDNATQENLRTLRKLLDVQREIPNFDKLYADSLIKGSLDKNIFDAIKQIEKLNAGNIGDWSKRYVGTAFYNVLDVFADSFSADKPSFIENNIYFEIGDIGKGWSDKGYLFSDSKFTEIDLTTGKTTKTRYRGEKSKLVDVMPGGVNVRDYIESSALRQQVSDAIITRKFENTLNSVLLDKNGHLLTKMPDSFINVGNIKSGINKYGSVWSDVNKLFIGKQSQGRNTSNIYKNINELADTYNYAVLKNFIDTKSRPSSSGELIRQINNQIAQSPKEYIGKEYDTILRNTMTEIFGGDEILDRYIKEAKDVVPFFDNKKSKKYKDALDFLKTNTYDIMEQQRVIEGSFASVKTELDGLQKQGVSSDELKSLQDILDSSSKSMSDLLNILRTENTIVVNDVQKDIYNLFNSTAQMESFFGWTKTSDDTIVGFGNYIGKTFKELSKSDIDAILEAGEIAKKSLDLKSVKEEYAITHTIDALNAYKPKALQSAVTAMKTSTDVNKLIDDNKKAVTALHEQLAKRTPEQIKEAEEQAAKSFKKKTVSGSFLSQAKDAFSKMPKRNIGIAVGAMAALGIANNLLHGEKNQTPLTPARKSGGNNSPNMISPAENNQAPQLSQAPMSQRRTVYHDKASGFNFKVSANTNRYINDVNNAKLIGMSGGGQASVYSQSDMSGVTDNWLANKFAELT